MFSKKQNRKREKEAYTPIFLNKIAIIIMHHASSKVTLKKAMVVV